MIGRAVEQFAVGQFRVGDLAIVNLAVLCEDAALSNDAKVEEQVAKCTIVERTVANIATATTGYAEALEDVEFAVNWKGECMIGRDADVTRSWFVVWQASGRLETCRGCV